MESVQHWLSALPPGVIYTVVALVVGIESLGVPLPGETALVAAALLTTSGITNVWWVAAAASLGAIVGDSIGYAIGRRGGRSLLAWLGRRFPNHLGPPHLAKAEQIFQRRGAWAIFFGRFIALLRIFAGPLAGALRVRYATFLLANASGGILWASGTTFAVYAAGKAADRWLKNFSWIALAVAIVAGITTTLILRHRAKKSFDVQPDEDDKDTEASLTS
ncbi:DedA family protein [Rugosimonospora africana]|uniref:Membrane protein n=1 Tax=Rugosimonospora africana TaxID=556532 RepID=A0A8J3VSV3_9ACTN|nr:DedA family protein [Rugosimonospora africana]GIH17006.1 membrane protein [Rugosimonospora africana]